MSRVAVIGLGSAHGDDSLGWRVIDSLERQTSAGAIELMRIHGSHIAWLARYGEFDRLVFIDAVCSGAMPGTLHEFDVPAQAADSCLHLCSSHGLGMIESLRLAESLHRRRIPVSFFGIELAQTDAGAGITPQVEAAIPGLVASINRCLQ